MAIKTVKLFNIILIYFLIIIGDHSIITVAQLDKFTFTNNEHLRAYTLRTITTTNRIQCLRACKEEEFCFGINVEQHHGSKIDIVCWLLEGLPDPGPYETGNVGNGFILEYGYII